MSTSFSGHHGQTLSSLNPQSTKTLGDVHVLGHAQTSSQSVAGAVSGHGLLDTVFQRAVAWPLRPDRAGVTEGAYDMSRMPSAKDQTLRHHHPPASDLEIPRTESREQRLLMTKYFPPMKISSCSQPPSGEGLYATFDPLQSLSKL
ncbi:hypothetical protein RRG08_025846 [Elysia crispata]|uniref:Uncharacterized protein n=1 Tax=Elysia crispata TaxID=231223 RepID=A0AAE0Y415_9GAST|nr:hypothetical protein RRG08_025846 [Elysia crispata]